MTETETVFGGGGLPGWSLTTHGKQWGSTTCGEALCRGSLERNQTPSLFQSEETFHEKQHWKPGLGEAASESLSEAGGLTAGGLRGQREKVREGWMPPPRSHSAGISSATCLCRFASLLRAASKCSAKENNPCSVLADTSA